MKRPKTPLISPRDIVAVLEAEEDEMAYRNAVKAFLKREKVLARQIEAWPAREIDQEEDPKSPFAHLPSPARCWLRNHLRDYLLRGLLVAAEAFRCRREILESGETLFTESAICCALGLDGIAESSFFDPHDYLEREPALAAHLETWALRDLETMPGGPGIEASLLESSYWSLRDFFLRGVRLARRATCAVLESSLALKPVKESGDAGAVHSGSAVIVSSSGADAPPGAEPEVRTLTAPFHYVSRCWNCGDSIEGFTKNPKRCDRCGWFKCVRCGACGCNYAGNRSPGDR